MQLDYGGRRLEHGAPPPPVEPVGDREKAIQRGRRNRDTRSSKKLVVLFLSKIWHTQGEIRFLTSLWEIMKWQRRSKKALRFLPTLRPAPRFFSLTLEVLPPHPPASRPTPAAAARPPPSGPVPRGQRGAEPWRSLGWSGVKRNHQKLPQLSKCMQNENENKKEQMTVWNRERTVLSTGKWVVKLHNTIANAIGAIAKGATASPHPPSCDDRLYIIVYLFSC